MTSPELLRQSIGALRGAGFLIGRWMQGHAAVPCFFTGAAIRVGRGALRTSVRVALVHGRERSSLRGRLVLFIFTAGRKHQRQQQYAYKLLHRSTSFCCRAQGLSTYMSGCERKTAICSGLNLFGAPCTASQNIILSAPAARHSLTPTASSSLAS